MERRGELLHKVEDPAPITVQSGNYILPYAPQTEFQHASKISLSGQSPGSDGVSTANRITSVRMINEAAKTEPLLPNPNTFKFLENRHPRLEDQTHPLYQPFGPTPIQPHQQPPAALQSNPFPQSQRMFSQLSGPISSQLYNPLNPAPIPAPNPAPAPTTEFRKISPLVSTSSELTKQKEVFMPVITSPK